MKKNIKIKMCAGILAITMAGTPLALAKADYAYSGKKVVVSATQYDEKFDDEKYNDYFAETNLSDCEDFGITHLHAYVDDSGNIIKWICSEQLQIDDLHWTSKRKAIEPFELIDDNVIEPHAHLYYSLSSNYLLPFYSEEPMIDGEFMKTSKIVFLEEKKCKELRQTGVFRVCDNLEQLQKTTTIMKEYDIFDGYTHFSTLSPVYIDDKIISMENIFFEIADKIPEEHYNDLLYQNGYITGGDKMKELSTYVEFKKVDDFQKDFIISYQTKNNNE